MAVLEEDDLDNQQENPEVEQTENEEKEFFFVLEFERFPVKIQNPETGVVEDYELREMSGDKRDAFMNSMQSKLRNDGSVKDYKDVQATLLAIVLFRVGSGTPVQIGAIRKFPAKMLDKLYLKAVKMNALNKEAEAAAKKS